MPIFRILIAALLALPFTSYGTNSALAGHEWSDAAKEAVGTAFGKKSSPVWFTLNRGILTEVYFPRIDRAQVGDSQLLFTLDGKFLEEKRDFKRAIEHPPAIPRPVVKATYGEGSQRISFLKEFITDPGRPVVRVRYRFRELPPDAVMYVLHKPTADNDGAHDRGRLLTRRQGATAFIGWDNQSKEPTFQAVIVNVPVIRASVGIVGETDGWQDLSKNKRMSYEIQANEGNLAYTAQLRTAREIEVVIGFGTNPESALNAAVASLGDSFNGVRAEYDDGWNSYVRKLETAPWLNGLPGKLREALLWDATIIKAHEDKLNPGAIVASLSIPNIPAGRGHGDGKETGGYHLVWPRDLFKSALGLLRLGDIGTAHNVMRFMTRMEHDGKMAQNAWVDGRPYWTGEQMDEEAFPVLLAHELARAGADISEFRDFIARRLNRLRQSGGRTGQERWEEAGGYSPNTIAVMAAAMARMGDAEGAQRMLRIALETTVSKRGPLSQDPYFIRISTSGNPDDGRYLQIANGGPAIPEYRILDGGFLEWVRWFPSPTAYFGEAAGSALVAAVRNTLPIYDDPDNGVAIDFDGIPLYRRYNGDAYGMHHRGGPWPILTLERALPELASRPAAGLRYSAFVRSLFGPGDMCPEQLDQRGAPMPYAATPLVWCHAELIELAYRTIQAGSKTQ